ncbi:MAG: hypothetical protein K6U74_18800 [Firmicutes bacterium]|nr:hypothetical protein [Bacillota bacterium]
MHARFIRGLMVTIPDQGENDTLIFRRQNGLILASGNVKFSFLVECREIIDDLINKAKKEIVRKVEENGSACAAENWRE